MTKAVIVARFSPRPDASTSESNESQIADCRAYAAERGYEVSKTRTFADAALSGMDDERDPDPAKVVARRPGLSAAIEATKRGMVLLCRARDRISREGYIQEYVERMLNAGGALLEAAKETNEASMAGRLYRTVAREFARDQVERTRLLTHLAMIRHQYVAGRRMSRREFCPFGWACDPADDSRLIEVPEEQFAIGIIKAAAKRGETLRGICRLLDAKGIQRRGKGWDGAHILVRNILNRNSGA